jgi:flagellar biosynthesis/type III secretory pathway chaperone
MTSSLPGLVDILDEESALYEQLLALLAEEEQALLNGNGLAVASCLPKKETLTAKIRLAELSRQATVARIAGRAEARIADLPPTAAAELGTARTRLSTLLPQVDVANRRVEVLLQRATARLYNALDMIEEAAGTNRRYGARGELLTARAPRVEGEA